MQDLERFHTEWSTALPAYERLVEWATKRLVERTREIGLPCDIEGRAKEMASFLKKCVTKGYTDPLTQMPDKAGLRVILFCRDGLPDVDRLVRELFSVIKADDHWTSEEDVFGYAAVHYDVECRSVDDFAGTRFEIQVHTAGQHLWATTSHKLAYKGVSKPDPTIRRRIHRLAALLEIFDQDVEIARTMILSNPSYKGAYALSVLERHYYRLTGRPYDEELSVYVLDALSEFIPPPEKEVFAGAMADWVNSNSTRLEQIFQDYKDDTRSLLVFQPESLLIFKLLGEDEFSLEEAWNKSLPTQLLVPLADIWGVHIADG